MPVRLTMLLEMDVDVEVPDMDGLKLVSRDVLDKVADAIEFSFDSHHLSTKFNLSTLIKKVI